MTSLAADTREAVRQHPFLLAAVRAEVVNYTAAARFLAPEIGRSETDAIVTALRRFSEDVPAYETVARTVRVEMKSGLEKTDGDDALFAVGDDGYALSDGSLTGIVATGNVDVAALSSVLGRLATGNVDVQAAGVAGDSLVAVVSRRDGADAVRAVEDALADVPESYGYS